MELLQAIEQTFCKLRQPNGRQLKEALQRLDIWLQTVPQYKSQPEQLPYGRNVLYRSAELEVIVIHIPAYQATAIHDHGGSVGCAYMATGQLLNTIYRLDEDEYPVEEAEHLIRAGTFFDAPAGQIHQLSNPGHEPAVSLHAYAPTMKDAKRYIPYSEILDFVI